MIEVQELTDFAAKVARDSGNAVLDNVNSHHTVSSKAKYDFVTDMDRMSEKRIRTAILDRYPDHLFFGEEEVSSAEESEDELIGKLPEDAYIWIVDPIDGTTNFIKGIPQFVVSIAVMYRHEIVAGAIYEPSRNELFYAGKGLGAYLNGRRIQVSDTPSFSEAMVSTGFPAADMEEREYRMHQLAEINQNFMSLRIWNCAAMAIAYVACGRTDAHYEAGIHLWDFSAGKILVEEAGGVLTDLSPEPFSLYSRNILADNGKIHNEICEKLFE